MSFRSAFPCLTKLNEMAVAFGERGLRLRCVRLSRNDFRKLLDELPAPMLTHPLFVGDVEIKQATA